MQKIPALNKIDKKISLSPTNNNNNHQMNKIHKIVQKTMNNSTKINKKVFTPNLPGYGRSVLYASS